MDSLTSEQGSQATANFYNDIQIGFCIIKVDFDEQNRRADYRFVEVNEAFEQHTGLINATGQWMRNLAPDHEQFWFDRYAETARTGRPARFEYTAQALGGRHFEVYAYRTGEPEQQRVAVLFADISARKRADELRTALFALTDRLAEHDDVAGLTDVACSILGTTLDVQLVGYGLVDLEAETISIDRDWTTGGAQSLAGTLRFREFGSYIDDIKRGETVAVSDARTDPRTQATAAALEAISARALVNEPISEQGQLVALLYVCTNKPRNWSDNELMFIREVAARTRSATARRTAELALRASETTRADTLAREVAERTADRNALWQLSNDLMLRCTFAGAITAVNPAWTELLGWHEGELIGANLFEFIHPDDRVQSLDAVRQHADGTRYTRYDNRYRQRDGGYRWISWTTRPADGLVNAVGRDITADKEQAQALEATAEALRQSQKMEAVGQLTGGVAHDFNNLLTIIRSSVDFLRRPNLPEERRTRYMDAVSETVDRAAKLTGQLLAFARRQALKPEVLNVSDRLRAVADMLDTVTGARVKVVTELPQEPCFIKADLSQFETALVNMAVNARDAMDGAGTFTMRLVCGARMPSIRGHAGSTSSFAQIELSDTGSGIAEGDLARIFEPFFTTKEVGKGTGLGLSQVFGFAKQSGGDVDVHSTRGEGTTFTLYLPEVEVPVEHPVTGEDTGPAPGGDGQRVLVVEDNIEVGKFATQILEDLGYRTEWAANAEEALDRLGPDGDGFDLVFSDVVMPGMGGVALAEELRRRLPTLPVVLTSGYSNVLAENDAHGFELLHKPYSADQLSRMLQRMARRRWVS